MSFTDCESLAIILNKTSIDVDGRNYSWWWCRLWLASICRFEVITWLSALPLKLAYISMRKPFARIGPSCEVRAAEHVWCLCLSVYASRAHACVNRFHLHNFIHSLFIQARLCRIGGRISCNPHTKTTDAQLPVGTFEWNEKKTKQQTDN